MIFSPGPGPAVHVSRAGVLAVAASTLSLAVPEAARVSKVRRGELALAMPVVSDPAALVAPATGAVHARACPAHEVVGEGASVNVSVGPAVFALAVHQHLLATTLVNAVAFVAGAILPRQLRLGALLLLAAHALHSAASALLASQLTDPVHATPRPPRATPAASHWLSRPTVLAIGRPGRLSLCLINCKFN